MLCRACGGRSTCVKVVPTTTCCALSLFAPSWCALYCLLCTALVTGRIQHTGRTPCTAVCQNVLCWWVRKPYRINIQIHSHIQIQAHCVHVCSSVIADYGMLDYDLIPCISKHHGSRSPTVHLWFNSHSSLSTKIRYHQSLVNHNDARSLSHGTLPIALLRPSASAWLNQNQAKLDVCLRPCMQRLAWPRGAACGPTLRLGW